MPVQKPFRFGVQLATLPPNDWAERVRSIGTTTSAPAGIGAPVMIFMAVPEVTTASVDLPAGCSSMSSSVTGVSSPAPAISAVSRA